MSAMPPLRNILNNTPATAVDVDWNFQTIEDYLANEVIKRDGTVAMQAPLNLLGAPPSIATHAVPKSYVDAIIPIGMMAPYGGAAAPAGWALCDGTIKSQTDPAYAALFAAIGSAFNTGAEGAGNFRLPDMRGRMPIGKGAAHTPTLGAVGGRTDALIPSHAHDLQNHVHNANHNHSASMGTENVDHTHAFSGLTGGDAGHDHPVMAGGEPIWGFFGGGTLGMDTAGTGHTGAPSNLTAVGHKTGWMGPHNHSYGGNTGGRSAGHVHAITVDGNNFNTAGPSTNATSTVGESGVNGNLPPYAVVNYIIRIG